MLADVGKFWVSGFELPLPTGQWHEVEEIFGTGEITPRRPSPGTELPGYPHCLAPRGQIRRRAAGESSRGFQPPVYFLRPQHLPWQRACVSLLVVEHDTVNNRALNPLRGHEQAAAIAGQIVVHLRSPA